MSARTTSLVASDETATHRPLRLMRVIVLLLAGGVVTFSATLHEQLAFDRTVVSTSLAALAVVAALTWYVDHSTTRMTHLAYALLAALGAVVVALSTTPLWFAVGLAAWALIGGLSEFIAAALGTTQRGDRVFMGAIGMLLAILVLLVRDDAVAAIGFFGAYAIVGGVFLGISAFDGRRTDSATHDGAAAPVDAHPEVPRT